ncbi:hypothetical protein L195_g014590 [Trifolium pratense]|uniref:TF-B3 domain-containing protein n=2 Tax=Trifolium pratense TaxID=57577 RepID=A0A2K3PRC0_TRIPR|nr:hypothetical protein L195_g014590 [Trifolium pratense]CAJ2645311.1 unnamed protein product [Trifolium pratense]
MENYSKYLQVTPIASFTVIFLANQIYGEVDPSFVKEYFGELLEIWEFMDYQDKIHSVTFNKSVVHPLLTSGWKQMKDVFLFNPNQEIDFLYYGNSLFGMMCSKRLECVCQIPMYHSRFLKFGYTLDFYLQLSYDVLNKGFLNITGAFEDYMRYCDFKILIACCDNGMIIPFQVALTDEPFRTTSIGTGWEYFCQENRFVAGDVLCFKFNIWNYSNSVNVYKINE